MFDQSPAYIAYMAQKLHDNKVKSQKKVRW